MIRIALALGLAVSLCACPNPQGCGPATDTVVEVVDGDTVKLAGGETVRYLMADSTEITKGKNECYGQEAASFNKSMVLDKQVTLAYDVECRDKYGRLLAYVSVDGIEVNSLEVERGFACVLHIPPNGAERELEFADLQAQAKAAKRGVWGACDPVPCAN